ncbi:MAG: T9SS C-terminal target domain-containing protein [Calditrichaeota bacterium]|nr:MAG: T9SS C-terminal target domain-containing protein [Calditrichota bacterium]
MVNSNASENNNLVIPINVELIALSGEEKSNEIPNEFSLSQNYPNPFNPTTIINYQLAMNSEGKLIIFNILGEKVREFSLKNSQGSITWNGTDNFERNVSSGIYFYKLETEGFSETKKMLLLK